MIRIVQYIQPWEIDDCERQIDQLIKSSYYCKDPINITIDITMNLDIVDWSNSKLPKIYFEDKFKYLNTKASLHFTTEFDTDISIRGAADKRRACSLKQQDYTIWLDSDIFFSIHTLPLIQQALEQITDKAFILTPEIIKYWDDSWDCITNARYLTQPHNHRDFFDLFSLDYIVPSNEMSLDKLNTNKFGAGWFTVLSNEFTNQITIPSELGSYGPDDTYVMICSQILNLPQYVLRGVVVSENGKLYLNNKDYIKPLLCVKVSDKDKITNDKLNELIQSFILTNQKN
jgi:hypothetical protein